MQMAELHDWVFGRWQGSEFSRERPRSELLDGARIELSCLAKRLAGACVCTQAEGPVRT